MLRSSVRLAVVGLLVSVALGASTVSAQLCAVNDIRCQNVPVTWRGEARLFDDVGFDTGFVPRNSPVSIRAAFGLLSRTTADMTGMLRAQWPSPLTINLTGDEGSGQLNIDFGLVFEVQLKLDIDVGIASINRTFDIPVGLPTNLAFRGTKPFMPLLLPGQAGRPVSLVTNTSRIRVANFSVPVVAGLSVGGGLDIRGTMTTRYATEHMLVDGVTVLAESQGTLVGPVNAAAGFGAFQDIPTRPVGAFEYAVGIELIPVITVSFFSFNIASIDISSFAVQAFESDGPAVFATVPAHVPLPDVRFISTVFNFPSTEVGDTSVLRATVRNFGEATLYVDMTTLPEPFTSELAQLVIEPGRFLVAEAGVLLCHASQVVEKDGVLRVGLDAGMNALLRPALYDAWHDIVNLSRRDEDTARDFDVVGPICESSDVFGHRVKLPAATAPGDVMLIADAGAYGFSMASTYNLRALPAESLLSGG